MKNVIFRIPLHERVRILWVVDENENLGLWYMDDMQFQKLLNLHAGKSRSVAVTEAVMTANGLQTVRYSDEQMLHARRGA